MGWLLALSLLASPDVVGPADEAEPEAAEVEDGAVVEESFTEEALTEEALASEAEPETKPADEAPPFCPLWPRAPFAAWVTADSANIRLTPEKAGHVVGLVHKGDQLLVTGCAPDCTTPGAWALLDNAGAIRLSVLQPVTVEGTHAAPVHYVYARVRKPGAHIYAKPDVRSRTLSKQKAGRVLAFVESPEAPKGWLRHVSGGFVREAELARAKASQLTGVRDPGGPIAFLKKAAVLEPVAKGERRRALPRQSHLPLLGLLPGNRVRVEGGALPRSAVALAFVRPRPKGVAPEDRWVHVDVNEQVLVAYEGDRPVLATMVTSGRQRTPTHEGLFRVWAKISHSDMRGGGRKPYVVEEVPYVLSFDHGQALHGALWHDRFGNRGSHGCVNLAPNDASWIFNWAPPALPTGWHTVVTRFAGLGSLWVQVERAPLGSFAQLPAPIPAPQVEPAPVEAALAPQAPAEGGPELCPITGGR